MPLATLTPTLDAKQEVTCIICHHHKEGIFFPVRVHEEKPW